MSKIRRELIRLLLQAVCGALGLFPQRFSGTIKRSWNNLQREEGIMFTKGLAMPVRHGVACGLDIRQTSGFGEAVHLDVIYVPGGFGARGWPWLMTLTPFPGGIVYFENPEFLVSCDGMQWHVPEGVPSPLVSAPSDWIGYNSDPSLLHYGNRLYLFYREVRAEDKHHDRVRLFAMSTEDGVAWDERRTLFDKTVDKTNGAILLSPTVLNVEGVHLMWYVESDGNCLRMKRCIISGMANIRDIREVELVGMKYEDTPWHIDVVDDRDSLVMALCVRDKLNGRRHSIVFARSTDQGLTWHVFGDRIEPDDSLHEKSLYRASLVKNVTGMWSLYYSFQDPKGHWFPLVRNILL